VRIIAVDGYGGELGRWGIINKGGREWVEGIIKSTPWAIDHIFITFHAPAFPRYRHLQDSFNAAPEERNAFWNMLIGHRARVRAVFVAHTHFYYRMRVRDPAGVGANDTSLFPDEDGGIYQVDVGAAGRGRKNTVLQVQIDGKNVLFRALQAENGSNQPFGVKDEWQIIGEPLRAGSVNHLIQEENGVYVLSLNSAGTAFQE